MKKYVITVCSTLLLSIITLIFAGGFLISLPFIILTTLGTLFLLTTIWREQRFINIKICNMFFVFLLGIICICLNISTITINYRNYDGIGLETFIWSFEAFITFDLFILVIILIKNHFNKNAKKQDTTIKLEVSRTRRFFGHLINLLTLNCLVFGNFIMILSSGQTLGGLIMGYRYNTKGFVLAMKIFAGGIIASILCIFTLYIFFFVSLAQMSKNNGWHWEKWMEIKKVNRY